MANTRVPRTPSGFSAYVNNTRNYLLLDTVVIPGMYIPQPYLAPVPPAAPAVAVAPGMLKIWQRLWLLPSEMDMWTGFALQYNGIYDKYSNKEESRTTAVTDNLHKVIEDFIAFATPILTRIAGDPYVTVDDMEVFHIKSGFLKDSTATRHRAPVQDVPEFSMLAIGGGDLRFHVRNSHDTKRASKMPGTQIEIRFKVANPGTSPPAHVVDLTGQEISSKALFVFHSGEINTGKVLYAAVRWIVVSDPSRNGPWTSIQNIVIS